MNINVQSPLFLTDLYFYDIRSCYYEIAKSAYYDLGGIDPDGNPGVYHFKKGLGGLHATMAGPFEMHPNVMKKIMAILLMVVFLGLVGVKLQSWADWTEGAPDRTNAPSPEVVKIKGNFTYDWSWKNWSWISSCAM